MSYAEAGLICKRVETEMLWRARCSSLTEWIRTACPFGYATAFAAYRAVKELADIPEADLKQIPKSNIETLRQLSTAVRSDPAVLKSAKHSTNADFIAQIKRDHPQQHVQSRVPLRWMADETQAATIRGAIAKALERGAQSEIEALVDISINYEADILIEEGLKEESDANSKGT